MYSLFCLLLPKNLFSDFEKGLNRLFSAFMKYLDIIEPEMF